MPRRPRNLILKISVFIVYLHDSVIYISPEYLFTVIVNKSRKHVNSRVRIKRGYGRTDGWRTDGRMSGGRTDGRMSSKKCFSAFFESYPRFKTRIWSKKRFPAFF